MKPLIPRFWTVRYTGSPAAVGAMRRSHPGDTQLDDTVEVAGQPESTRDRVFGSIRRHWAFGLLLAGALALHLYHLAHTFLAPWDEAFHAVVAAHLAQHPFQPTLYDTAALNVPGSTSWGGYIHIWLHIPPFGLWASALSIQLVGLTPLAVRLPGVLFVVTGMVATYYLGRRLFGSGAAGLVGAAFIGYAPYLMLLTQGYVFGDMTDTPLLALTPLAVLALVVGYQSGKLRWIVLAGVFQGLCYLTKGGLGLAPLGVAMALYVAEWIFTEEAGWRRLGLRGLLTFAGIAVLVAGPYNLYIAHTYPTEYKQTNAEWVQGFFHDLENWGRPTDYHLTMYLFALYGAALALILVSALVALGAVGLLRQSRADIIPVVWALTLYLPLSVAVSKAVPMTIGAVPALGLATGRLLTLTLGSKRVWWRIAGVSLLWSAAVAAVIIASGWHAPLDFDPSAAVVGQFWPYSLHHRELPYLLEIGLLVAFAVALAAALWVRGTRGGAFAPWFAGRGRGAEEAADRRAAPPARRARWTSEGGMLARVSRGTGVTLVLAVLAVAVLGAYWVNYDLQVVARVPDNPGPAQVVGTYLEHLTGSNTTVLVDSVLFPLADQSMANERLMIMFWAQRDVYPVDSIQSATVCPLVLEAGKVHSPVVVVTNKPFSGHAIGEVNGWTVYTPIC